MQIGETIKNTYRVERTLGEGGMGAVYEVTHLRTGRRYAMKVMRKEALTQEGALARFRREAEALGRLGHANVIAIHDFDELDGGAYLVMELLAGEDLDERLGRERRFSIPDARRVFLQIAAGLEAAHQAGIMHRDLKPANVFLARYPGSPERAVVLDFGLAKGVEEPDEQKLTRTGVVMGTPRYMSPEQAAGAPLDERTDLYALATILFEMLTGHTPFEAPTLPALFAKLVTDPPPSPRYLRPDLPPALDEVMARALAKAKDDRYPSVRALVDAVIAALGGTPVSGVATHASVAPTVAAPVATTPLARSGSLSETGAARRRGATLAAVTIAVVVGALFGVAVIVPLVMRSSDDLASSAAETETALTDAAPAGASTSDPPPAAFAVPVPVPDAGACTSILRCARSCDGVFAQVDVDESFADGLTAYRRRSGLAETTAAGLALGGERRLGSVRSIARFDDGALLCIEAHLPAASGARQHEAVFSLRRANGGGISLVLRGTDRRIGLLNMQPFRPLERVDCPWLGEERDVRVLMSLIDAHLYLEVQRVDTGEVEVLHTQFFGPTESLFSEIEMLAPTPMTVTRVRMGAPSSLTESLTR